MARGKKHTAEQTVNLLRQVVAKLPELFADPDGMGSRLHRDPVMAPDISKIDPNRHPNLGDTAWNFRDEVVRWLFHGNSLSGPRRPAHPILRPSSRGDADHSFFPIESLGGGFPPSPCAQHYEHDYLLDNARITCRHRPGSLTLSEIANP
jgi:hypothetical protein